MEGVKQLLEQDKFLLFFVSLKRYESPLILNVIIWCKSRLLLILRCQKPFLIQNCFKRSVKKVHSLYRFTLLALRKKQEGIFPHLKMGIRMKTVSLQTLHILLFLPSFFCIRVSIVFRRNMSCCFSVRRVALRYTPIHHKFQRRFRASFTFII